MHDLIRSLRRHGAPVEVPWPSLAGVIRPLAGNLMVVAARPKVGKSIFALNWAARIETPTLYVSLDTSLPEQAERLVEFDTREPSEVSLTDFTTEEEWREWCASHLRGLHYPIRFFDRLVEVDDLRGVVLAEEQIWGRPPAIVVIDNVGNLAHEESMQEYQRIFHELHNLARERSTLVMALHHIRRKPTDRDRDIDMRRKPVRLHEMMFAGDREVQVCLGLYRPLDQVLHVQVLANRMGNDNDVELKLLFNGATSDVREGLAL